MNSFLQPISNPLQKITYTRNNRTTIIIQNRLNYSVQNHRQTKRLKQSTVCSTNNGKVYISKIQNSPSKNNETLCGKRIACKIDTRSCLCHTQRFSANSDSVRVFHVVFSLVFPFSFVFVWLRVEEEILLVSRSVSWFIGVFSRVKWWRCYEVMVIEGFFNA